MLTFSAITADEVEIAAEEEALNTRRALAQIMDPEKAKHIALYLERTVKRIALEVPGREDEAGHNGPVWKCGG